MCSNQERGIALITTLLVMMLMSALLVGFAAVVVSDQRFRFVDRDRNQAFYAASGGIEKLTADLGNLFATVLAPTAAQLSLLTASASVPTINTIAFSASTRADLLPSSSLTRCSSPNAPARVGGNGYMIQFCAGPNGNPTTSSITPIKSGPFEGLIGLQTPYQFDVTARTGAGGEVHLIRPMEAVAIPVFQFGIFSDADLSFFAGPDFNFGGRIHTNGNLFLAEGGGATLTITDKVTAVKEVIRQQLQNGVSIDVSPGHAGTVKIATAPVAPGTPGVYRVLDRTEGSVPDGPSSLPVNDPIWHDVSQTAYDFRIRNGRTGAKELKLPLLTVGGTSADLIRRPPRSGEDVNSAVFKERLFAKASLRILLSDTAADITGLPSVTSTPPVSLVNNPGDGWPPAGSTLTVPIARSAGLVTAVTTGDPDGMKVTSGTGKKLQIPPVGGIAVPLAWQRLPPLTVVSSGGSYSVTCTGRTATEFTGCTGVHPLVHKNEMPPATVTATVFTAGGTAMMSTALQDNWTPNSGTISVVSTAGFGSMNTVWINGDLVTCGNWDATVLLECNLPADVASGSLVTSSAHSSAGTGAIGGFIKIERGNTDGSWTDVTLDILNYGIGAPNPGGLGVNLGGTPCSDPTPTAILRLQRLRDNNWATCTYGASANTTDYWPNVLFDAREALYRDTSAGANPLLGGVMHYVTIDTQNLSKWFAGATGFTAGAGTTARKDNGGFTVYFSDRRNNRNASSQETGNYGYLDFVNAGTAGTPNNTLDIGEDINGNGVLDTYGQLPSYRGIANTVPGKASSPLDASARPITSLTRGEAQVNRAILYRRALKLINGANIVGLGITGLTVVSENPVYIQGDWNTTDAGFTSAHAATAVMADAVTLLSNNWNDSISFSQLYQPALRPRTTTSFRLAIISGKGIAFPHPSGTATDFGTDGGAHNFLRYLEGGNATINYRGSIISVFYNRQAVGTFKCCETVYQAPTRNYTFDTEFLTPALLPPNTPLFRDINAIGFAQEIRPGR